jgi:hypothetical protein
VRVSRTETPAFQGSAKAKLANFRRKEGDSQDKTMPERVEAKSISRDRKFPGHR